MAFNPGVHMGYTAPIQRVATGAMMVPVAPVRQVALVPVSTVVVGAPHSTLTATSYMTTSSLTTISNGPQIQAQATEKPDTALGSTAPDSNKPADGAPVVTVFVGNITERASDTLVRQILMKCGTIYAWKRVQGASGKLQAFGFCEYTEPEAALRAISLLHDFQLGDKKILVKVDSKTQELIDAWKKKNSKLNNFVPGMVDARTGLDMLMREYQLELNTPVQGESEAPKKKEYPLIRESTNVEENLQVLDLEKDQKDYISKEIRSFREAQKLKEAAKLKEKKEREDELREKEEKERERRKEREREKDRHRERHSEHRGASRSDRRITRSRSRSRRGWSPPRRSHRSRTPTRRTPIRSRSPTYSRRKSISPTRRRGDEDDESFERRRLERKIREKEAAYQERLKAWEIRERRKKREYEIRDERETRERKEMLKEAKRLQEFLADYDDDKYDHKYYVGSAMSKRRRDHEREIEQDKRDIKKEKEEIEMLRDRLTKDGYDNIQVAIDKTIKDSETVWKPPLKRDTPPREKSVEHDSSSSSESESDSEHEAERSDSATSAMDTQSTDSEKSPKRESTTSSAPLAQKEEKRAPPSRGFTPIGETVSNGRSSITSSNSVSPMFSQARASSLSRQEPVMQLPMGTSKRKKLKVSDIFNEEEEEEAVPKKRKLVPHQLTEQEKQSIQQANRSAEDRHKAVRSLIEQIPTKKEDLFDYTVDWSMVDKSLMEKRIQPWVRKKILEYIGEEEPTLVEFICSKIMSKSMPDRILEDVSMVLDDEAEVFVVKMWRLLIYETEAKKEGLNK